MSLVREALDKAEREAAARAARERGLPEKLSAAGQPYRAPRARLRAAPILALLLGVAALGAGGAFVVQSGLLSGTPSSVSKSGATPPEVAAPPAAEQKMALKGSEGQTPSPEADSETTASALPEREGTFGEPGGSANETPTPAEAPPSLQTKLVAGEASAGQRPPQKLEKKQGSPEPERFVREALLDGGATRVELGGIAWSEAAPLAYLNGKLRGVGESVAGLEIRSIEREQVVLSTRDRTIVLALR